MEWLAQALNFIMEPCYQLTGNWWLTILLFTVIIKIILLPLSLWCQKNSIVMVQLMPDLNRVKIKFYGDREAIGDKQSEIYKQHHYHPMLSLVPLAIQILILFGLVDVIHGITDYGAPGTELLGMVPFTDGGISWLMPLFAGISAIIMGFAQNRINPLQKEQGRTEKNATNGLSIGLSFVLGIFVATGMGFYWVCSNLMSIAIQALCNLIISPKKHIDYADLEASRAELADLEALDGNDRKWYQRNPLAKREKADYKRFFKTINKHIVFFSESSGFYRYFQGIIEWLLENSDVIIHYVTNDPNDQIFDLAEKQPRIRPYYIGPKRIITLMMKMDAHMVVATLEDLDVYYIKRSYIREDIEYVFLFHHMTSTHMTPHKGAFDGYDTVLCVGQHQIDEFRRAEELYETPAKNLVAYGYDLLDRTTEAYHALADKNAQPNKRPTVLIGPSWQEDCILDTCIDEIIDNLRGHGYRIIVRPHPEYTKRYAPRWEALMARHADVSEDELYFERDFSSNETVFTSDILITDWSSVAHEFSFAT
ncbi:MAG: YidC/Oxa1 family membrane protein insertase, partial [Raoultibacter sp.]